VAAAPRQGAVAEAPHPEGALGMPTGSLPEEDILRKAAVAWRQAVVRLEASAVVDGLEAAPAACRTAAALAENQAEAGRIRAVAP